MIKVKIFQNEWMMNHGNDIFAYSGLVLCLFIFSVFPPIINGIHLFEPTGLAFRSIVFDAVIYSVLASGAVFIYALGAMDISVGAQISLYSILLIYIYNIEGSTPLSIVIGILIILAIAMFCGTMNSVFAAILEMKPIITSLILQFFIYGISAVLMKQWNPDSVAMSFDIGTASNTHFAVLRNSWVQIMLLLINILSMSYLFNFTKVGKYTKAIGSNAEFAKQVGINIVKYRLLAYLIFGVTIVLASLLFVANTGSTTDTAAKGFEMKIMISLIIGGMPLSGGMKSKISSAVIGGITFALISRSFVFLGVSDKFTTLFVALIYIVVVLMTVRSKDRVLPR